MSDKSIKRILAGFICIGLTFTGFHYDSGWAFFGAVVAFFETFD
jgi:hypothetical protein